MLFAGHGMPAPVPLQSDTNLGLETTAHTLAATLGFLAYYPEIQEEVHEHILSVIGKSRDPVRGFCDLRSPIIY